MTDCTRFEASIVDFLEESLARGEHADLAAHAAACAHCTATLRAYRHIESAYQARAELEVRPELAARILAGARAEARPVRSRKRLVLLLGQAVVFLGCLVTGIILTVKHDGGIGVGLLIGWAIGVIVAPIVGFGVCAWAYSNLN